MPRTKPCPRMINFNMKPRFTVKGRRDSTTSLEMKWSDNKKTTHTQNGVAESNLMHKMYAETKYDHCQTLSEMVEQLSHRYNRRWDELLQEWIDWSESKATRKNKRNFGKQFVAYLKQEGVERPDDLSPKHLFAYKEQLMKNTSLSTNSMHAMLCSGVKSFCTFLFQEGLTRTNVGMRLKAPAYVQTPVQAMTEDDIRSLFAAANKEQRILLTFGFFLAMRVEALVSLQRKSITDIDYEKQTFVVTWTAKGDRRITKTCRNWDALPGGAKWVQKMDGWTPDTYLLPGRKPRSHITSRTAERWMKRLGTECGIQLDADGHSTITPHDLRHAGGTIVAKKTNGNAYHVKAHLHHKNISTTHHYVHLESTEVENVLGTTLDSRDDAV